MISRIFGCLRPMTGMSGMSVGCWVLGVGCWVLRPEALTPNAQSGFRRLELDAGKDAELEEREADQQGADDPGHGDRVAELEIHERREPDLQARGVSAVDRATAGGDEDRVEGAGSADEGAHEIDDDERFQVREGDVAD